MKFADLAILLSGFCVVAIPGCSDSNAKDTGASIPPVPAPAWFEECAAARGIKFHHQSGHRERYLIPEIMGGGAALFDIENDGDLDLYLVQSGSLYPDAPNQPANQLFRNRGDGTFENVTAGMGANSRGYGMGAAAGDCNNDGLTDLYITNLGPNVLLRNNGDGTFTDVTPESGVGHDGFGASAAFVDIEGDGDLDLLVTNYLLWSKETERECFTPGGQPDYCGPRSYEAPAPDVLFRNNGDGTFSDITREAGIDKAFGNGLGVICGDFTGDDRIDILVANDATPNQLWVNQGGNRFVDEAWQRGVAVDDDAVPKAGMGVTATDLGHDGLMDVLVVNLGGEADSLYLNHGEYFVDATATAGLGSVSRPFTRFGVAFCDFDNDGVDDLFMANGRVERALKPHSQADPYAEPNLLFRGVPGPKSAFEESLPRGGTNPELIATSRAAAFGDIDNDGGVDIVIVNRDGPAHLLRNVHPARGNWISLRVLNEHGGDAIGATLIVRTPERDIACEVRSAYSYLAANDPRVHIGLGAIDQVTDIIVRWPTGVVENFGDFKANRVVTLKRGSGLTSGSPP